MARYISCESLRPVLETPFGGRGASKPLYLCAVEPGEVVPRESPWRFAVSSVRPCGACATVTSSTGTRAVGLAVPVSLSLADARWISFVFAGSAAPGAGAVPTPTGASVTAGEVAASGGVPSIALEASMGNGNGRAAVGS